jgi:phosphoheptose isomerase
VADPGKILHDAIDAGTATLRSLDQFAPTLERAAELVTNCLTNGNKLLACGNGGSAADAADFTTEFACRFLQDRRPYPAINLSAGGSLLTATGNDYGFNELFARQVRAFGRPGDVVVVISTSGKSANIRRALEESRQMKLKSIALLGRDGGASRGLADLEFIVKNEATARIQEAHKFLLHVLCQICEERLPK